MHYIVHNVGYNIERCYILFHVNKSAKGKMSINKKMEKEKENEAGP